MFWYGCEFNEAFPEVFLVMFDFCHCYFEADNKLTVFIGLIKELYL